MSSNTRSPLSATLSAALALCCVTSWARELPEARPGPDLRVGADETIDLSARASTGVSDRSLRYRWRQAAGPRVGLSRRQSQQRDISFKAIEAGDYVFSLTVLDGRLRSDPTMVKVQVPENKRTGKGNRRPVASGKASQVTVDVGERVDLDGAGSRDPDGDELKYRWTKLSGPPGNPADPASAQTELWPLGTGKYVFELVVHDGLLPSIPARVMVIAVAAEAPVRRAAPTDPMDKPVQLVLEGANLQRAVELFPSRIGITIRVDHRFMSPKRLRTVPVSFRADKLPARKLCDWLARFAGARYVPEDGGAVWLTRGYDWLRKEELTAQSYRIEGLKWSDNGSELRAAVRDIVKAALFARPESSISIDKDKGVLTAIVPASAQKRIRALFALLRTPRASVPGAPTVEKFPAKLLGAQVSCRFDSAPLDKILKQLSDQTGVSFAYVAAKLPSGRTPTIKLALGKTSLKAAVETIVARTGFRGYLAEPPSAIWFYTGTRPLETSEHLWTASIVSAYDLSGMMKRRSLAPGVILHLIRSRIQPATWKDPSTSISYNRPTKRLVVATAPAVHAEIGTFLQFLDKVGYKHFAGPDSPDSPRPKKSSKGE